MTDVCRWLADAASLLDGGAPRRRQPAADVAEVDPSSPAASSGPLSRIADFQFFAALLSPVLEVLERGPDAEGASGAAGELQPHSEGIRVLRHCVPVRCLVQGVTKAGLVQSVVTP